MAWNQPGNDDQDKHDPWGEKNNRKKRSTHSGESLFEQLSKLMKSGSNGNPSNRPTLRPSTLLVIVIVAGMVFWAISGFFTVQQNQRGVITRFGKVLPQIAQPGLNWQPTLIDKVYLVDTQSPRELSVQGFMITGSEDLIYAEMRLQYRITDPKQYLFNAADAEKSLKQAANSALSQQISDLSINQLMYGDHTDLIANTKQTLTQLIKPYALGIEVVDLNLNNMHVPKEVQTAFDDVAKAKADRMREIEQAKADKVQTEQQAQEQATRIVSDAETYKVKVVAQAQGDIERFKKLLPAYRAAPEITRDHLYFKMMEQLLSQTHKVIVNDKNSNVTVLPMEQIIKAATLSRQNELDMQSHYPPDSDEDDLPSCEAPADTAAAPAADDVRDSIRMGR